MKVVSFDLSSTLIGVSIAIIDEENKKIEKAVVFPVIPKNVNGRDMGYTTKNRKKVELRSGETVNTFLKEGEVIITKREAHRRNSMFKNDRHTYLLKDIGKKLGSILHEVNPDLVLIERNESFNGILTTKLLGEIAGGIYFWSGFYGCEMRSYNVATMRALINKSVKEADLYTDDGKSIVDTKMIVKRKLEKYFSDIGLKVENFENATLDESDSMLPIVYYYLKEVLKGEHE